MSKDQRGNKEAKKPKQEKPKPAAPGTARPAGVPATQAPWDKKQ